MEQDPNLIKYEELTKRISKVLLYFFLALVGLAMLIVFIAYMSKEIMFSVGPLMIRVWWVSAS